MFHEAKQADRNPFGVTLWLRNMKNNVQSVKIVDYIHTLPRSSHSIGMQIYKHLKWFFIDFDFAIHRTDICICIIFNFRMLLSRVYRFRLFSIVFTSKFEWNLFFISRAWHWIIASHHLHLHNRWTNFFLVLCALKSAINIGWRFSFGWGFLCSHFISIYWMQMNSIPLVGCDFYLRFQQLIVNGNICNYM